MNFKKAAKIVSALVFTLVLSTALLSPTATSNQKSDPGISTFGILDDTMY